MAGERWLLSFLGTLVVELPIYAWAARSAFGFGRAMVVGFALNTATHPLLWIALSQIRHPFPGPFLSAEAMVLAAEAGLLMVLSRSRIARRPLAWSSVFGISLAANGFSAGVGLLL